MRLVKKQAFTLLELLVVVTIIVVLISLLLPVLRNAREVSIQAECSSRLHQLGVAAFAYATDNDGHFPPGARDVYAGEHCIWMGAASYDDFSKYLGNGKTTAAYLAALSSGNAALANDAIDFRIACPNIATGEAAQLPFKGAAGWVIGYNYLADHVSVSTASTQAGMPWQSPRTIFDGGSLPLFCDLNDWAASEGSSGWTAISHRKHAAGGFFYAPDGARPPEYYNATGGNAAFLDGSVVWKNISEMKMHGHYDGSPTAYPGKW